MFSDAGNVCLWLAGNFADERGAWIKPKLRELSAAGEGGGQPFYTRWWFIAIVVIVVIGFFAG